MQEFLSLTGIENADKLLYTDRYPEEKSAITDLKRKYAFRLHIGKFKTVYSLTIHSLPTLDGEATVSIQTVPDPFSSHDACYVPCGCWDSYYQPVLSGLWNAFMSPICSAFTDFIRSAMISF